MYEINYVKQTDPDTRFRWFTSDNSNLDLYIWQNRKNKEIVRFQIYYDRNQDEKVVEWKGKQSLWYARVNSGGYGGYKASPILEREEEIDLQYVLALFKAYSKSMDVGIRRFVERKFQSRIM